MVVSYIKKISHNIFSVTGVYFTYFLWFSTWMWVIWFCCSWVCVFVVVFCLYTCLANAWRDCCHDCMDMCESETAMIKSLWSLEHRSALPMVIFILTIFVRVLRLSVDVIKTGLGLFQGRLPVQSQSHQLKAHRHVHQSFEITEESFHWRWEKTFICQLYFCVNTPEVPPQKSP